MNRQPTARAPRILCIPGILCVLCIVCVLPPVAACSASDDSAGDAQTQATAAGDSLAADRDNALPTYRIEADRQDSIIFEQHMKAALAERLDTLPIGEIVARIGKTFVGAPYIPGTLEAPGEEHLVVNLRTFDCVTFVENSLALARTIRSHGDFHQFERELARIRYRDGRLTGYTARLHYFTDWIANNEAKGIVTNITAELGGVPDPEPITFMTKHAEAYRQLSDSTVVREIRNAETRLTQAGRKIIPETKIAGVADQIHNGDIIAAATNVEGLDIAHTGIALWVDGELHLMHAPLVGSVVQISPNTLAERIVASKSQDGIMVARPR
jgi:hypothetical protein